MTEYTRTPIEVADMQWGDLIAAEPWKDGRANLFVGIDPSCSDYIISTDVGEEATVHQWWVKGVWFKLTPKPDPILCTHCGQEIDERFARWYHSASGDTRCPTLYATPAESDTT